MDRKQKEQGPARQKKGEVPKYVKPREKKARQQERQEEERPQKEGLREADCEKNPEPSAPPAEEQVQNSQYILDYEQHQKEEAQKRRGRLERVEEELEKQCPYSRPMKVNVRLAEVILAQTEEKACEVAKHRGIIVQVEQEQQATGVFRQELHEELLTQADIALAQQARRFDDIDEIIDKLDRQLGLDDDHWSAEDENSPEAQERIENERNQMIEQLHRRRQGEEEALRSLDHSTGPPVLLKRTEQPGIIDAEAEDVLNDTLVAGPGQQAKAAGSGSSAASATTTRVDKLQQQARELGLSGVEHSQSLPEMMAREGGDGLAFHDGWQDVRAEDRTAENMTGINQSATRTTVSESVLRETEDAEEAGVTKIGPAGGTRTVRQKKQRPEQRSLSRSSRRTTTSKKK